MFSLKRVLSPGHEIVVRSVVVDGRSVLVEAPAGYGEEALAQSLVQQGALLVDGGAALGEVDALLGRSEYSAVLLRAQRFDSLALGSFVDLMRGTLPVALLCRVAVPDIRDTMAAFDPVEFVAADLAWRPNELRSLLAEAGLSEELEELLFARTDGWPLAVDCVAAALRHATDEDAFDVLSAPSRCAPLVDAVAELVSGLPPTVSDPYRCLPVLNASPCAPLTP